jgi:hypothetical protein
MGKVRFLVNAGRAAEVNKYAKKPQAAAAEGNK